MLCLLISFLASQVLLLMLFEVHKTLVYTEINEKPYYTPARGQEQQKKR